jgi:hypothetical protein
MSRWIHLVVIVCAATTALAAVDLATPENSMSAFSAAVDAADVASLQEISLDVPDAERILMHLVALSRVTRDADDAALAAFGTHHSWHRNTPILNEIDAFQRSGFPVVEGDCARFVVDAAGTVRAALKRVDGNWKIDPTSFFNGRIMEMMDHSERDINAIEVMTKAIKAGEVATLEQAGALQAKILNEHPPRKSDPLPAPVLDSPESALAEYKAAREVGAFGRLREVMVPSPAIEKAVAADAAFAAAAKDLKAVAEEKFGPEVARVLPTIAPAREPSAAEWRDELAAAKAWADEFAVSIEGDGARAKFIASPAEPPIELKRVRGRWKVVEGADDVAAANAQMLIQRKVTTSYARLAADVRQGRIRSREEFLRALEEIMHALGESAPSR